MMEENKSSHQKKNKSRLSLTVGGGDGIGGVVLLGGGLAVAGLMAAFAIIKSRNGNGNGKKYEDAATPSNKNQGGNQGLCFVLQTPSTTVHQNSCCTGHETSKIGVTASQMDSSEIVSTHSLSLGDKPVPIMDREKENPINCHQEISSDDSNFSTDSSLPVPDGPSLAQPESMINDESDENLQLTETIEIKKVGGFVEKEILAVEEEDDDDSSEEVVIEDEEEEDCSEGELSMEENSPTQLVEEEENDGGASSQGHVIEKEEDVLEVEEEEEEESSEGEFSMEENSPIQLVEVKENGGGDCSEEHVVEREENVIGEEEESSLGELSMEENSLIQLVEVEENVGGDCGEEHVIEKEEESSGGELLVGDEVKKEDESVETGKLAVEENSPTQSVEEEEQEEDDDDSYEEHDIETEEENSEGKLSEEENPPMQSAEKEKGDDGDKNDEDSSEEHVIEKEEESSEGTVCSSMESNIEAIWPAEMIEALSQELKEMNAGNYDSGEMIEALSQELKEMNASNYESGEMIANKTEKYDFLECKRDRSIFNENESVNGTTENSTAIFHKKAAQELAMENDQTVHDLKRRIWVWSILVLLLLLLLSRIHHTAVPGDLYHDPVIVP